MSETSLLELGDEVSLGHFRINAVLQALHGGEGAPSRRAVLRNLVQHGPLTVPQLAALRPVSRQYIQQVVNGLERDGLVALQTNPAHRRSKLVGVTEAGQALLGEMLQREAKVFGRAADVAGDPEAVRAAVELLRRLRAFMDTVLVDTRAGDPS